MSVKLHRCPVMWPPTNRHPCHHVQRALEEAGIAFEVVKEPVLPRGRRKDVIANTGQDRLPAIELPDGSWYREESAAMAAAIRGGRLDAHRRA